MAKLTVVLPLLLLSLLFATNLACKDDFIGDGWCDPVNNSEDCQWDGGDCCKATCKSDDPDACGVRSHIDCKDPRAWNGCLNTTDISVVIDAQEDRSYFQAGIEFFLTAALDYAGEAEVTYDWRVMRNPMWSHLDYTPLPTNVEEIVITPDVPGLYQFSLKVSTPCDQSYTDSIVLRVGGEKNITAHCEGIEKAKSTMTPVGGRRCPMDTRPGRSVYVNAEHIFKDAAGAAEYETYEFEIVSYPAGSSFNTSDSVEQIDPAFEFVPDVAGVYTLKVSVDDGCHIMSEQVIVNVLADGEYSSCANLGSVGDGVCDKGNNNWDCCFDGGDCCESTCTGYKCGWWGYMCDDPLAEDWIDPDFKLPEPEPWNPFKKLEAIPAKKASTPTGVTRTISPPADVRVWLYILCGGLGAAIVSVGLAVVAHRRIQRKQAESSSVTVAL